jgi:hypothetical protein
MREDEKLGFNCCSPDWKEGMEDCDFNGKIVPSFVCWSPKGSITSYLLVAMLKKIDNLELFHRSDGIDPFLLLDGHGSRFEEPFVGYIHGDRAWTVCIGVPYGTSHEDETRNEIQHSEAGRDVDSALHLEQVFHPH